ncbi:MAG: single-stranded DNA-binding protein [Candidatus Thiodiazotropha sp.]
MGNEFRGRGNLGAPPALKPVEVDGEKRWVAEMRVYFDRNVPDGDDGFIDKGGFWLTVNLWGAKGETAANLLTKGVLVVVSGTLVNHEWIDKESGEPRSRLEVHADYVDLDLFRVEGIQLHRKESGDEAEAEQA